MGIAYPADVKTLMKNEVDIIVAKGGEVRLHTGGHRLLVDVTGRVKGATLRNMATGDLYDVHAKAVILASGGFQGSAELRALHFGRNADNLFVRGNENSVGDGYRMATAAGAALSKGTTSFYGHLLPSPLREDDIDRHKLPWVSQYESARSILVNNIGKRFCDENRMDDDNNQDVLRQPGSRAYLLMDDRVHKEHCVAPPFPNAGDIDRVQIAKDYGGRVAKADTVEDLIKQVSEWGVNSTNLTRTLDDYARYARGLRDVAVDAPITDGSAALLKAPFYALEVQPSITFPYGGLRINTDAQVLDHDGFPIMGLMGAGVDCGGFSNNSYAGGLVVAFITGEWAARSAVKLVAASASKL